MFKLKKHKVKKQIVAKEPVKPLVPPAIVTIPTEDIPLAISILREIYPDFDFNDYDATAELVAEEFEVKCTSEQVYSADKPVILPESRIDNDVIYREFYG